jgi:MFS family permease
VGGAAGAAVIGRLTDRLGRRAMYQLDLWLFVIFSLLSALAPNVAALIGFRFLLGVGIGADYPISSSYAAEFLPARLRGRLLVGAFSFQALGALAGATVGLVVLLTHPASDAWRWMLVAGTVPALVVVVLRRALPESPAWARARSAGGTERALPYRALFGRDLRRALVLATVPWFAMDICLYGVGFFTPTILALLAFSDRASWVARDIASTEGAMLLDVFLIVGFALAIWLVDSWGRMRLQLLGFAGMTVGLTLLAIGARLPDTVPLHIVLIFAGFALFNLAVNAGPNATTYLLPAELFPTELRASGHGLAAACGKLGATVGVFCLPLIREHWGLSGTVGLVAGASLLGLLVTWLTRTETRGRDLDTVTELPHPAV